MEGGDTNASAAGWLAFVGPGGAQPLLRHVSPSLKPCVPLLRAAAAATYTATSVRARCVSLLSHRRVEFAYINACETYFTIYIFTLSETRVSVTFLVPGLNYFLKNPFLIGQYCVLYSVL